MSLSFTQTVSFEVMKIAAVLRSVVSSISCRVRVLSPFAIEVMWVPSFSKLPVENRPPRIGCRNNDIGAFQGFFRARCRVDLDCQFTAHLFGESSPANFGGTEDFYLRQSSDGGSRLELRLRMDSTSKNRNPAGVFPGQVLGADAARAPVLNSLIEQS